MFFSKKSSSVLKLRTPSEFNGYLNLKTLSLSRGFLCLEFSEVVVPVLDKLYDQWSINAIPAIGKLVTGDGDPYQYLVESVRKFPDQETFAAMISKAGFEKVSFRNYTGGVAALHSGWKI